MLNSEKLEYLKSKYSNSEVIKYLTMLIDLKEKAEEFDYEYHFFTDAIQVLSGDKIEKNKLKGHVY